MLMDTLERAIVYTTVDLVDYIAGKRETSKLISKITGSVSIVASDAGVNTTNKVSPFDTLLYILEGSAEVKIDRQDHQLIAGQCIVLPAHIDSHIFSKTRFKMLVTVIKSGYEN
jgi:quercetin dioxygenase-like cupin family protein